LSANSGKLLYLFKLEKRHNPVKSHSEKCIFEEEIVIL
jgi:hypothetical protein